jgi:hypothetical protein
MGVTKDTGLFSEKGNRILESWKSDGTLNTVLRDGFRRKIWSVSNRFRNKGRPLFAAIFM